MVPDEAKADTSAVSAAASAKAKARLSTMHMCVRAHTCVHPRVLVFRRGQLKWWPQCGRRRMPRGAHE